MRPTGTIYRNGKMRLASQTLSSPRFSRGQMPVASQTIPKNMPRTLQRESFRSLRRRITAPPTISASPPIARLWDDIYIEATSVNPSFNPYRILDGWPVLWDVLGFIQYTG